MGGAWPCVVYKGEGGMALCTVHGVVGAWHCVVYSGEGGMTLCADGGGGGYGIVWCTKVFGWCVGFFWGASYLYNVQEPPKQAVAMNVGLFWYAAQVYAFFASSAEHKAV